MTQLHAYSLSEFGPIRSAWADILKRSDADKFFQATDWVEVFLAEDDPSRQASVLILSDGNHIVGGAALCFERREKFLRLGTLGYHLADYEHWALGDAGESKQQSVARRILKAVSTEYKWHYIELNKVPSESDTARYLPAAAQSLGLEVNVTATETSPFIPVTQSWLKYYQSLSKKFRRNYERSLKVLEREHGEVRFDWVANSHDLVEALTSLTVFHSKRRARIDGISSVLAIENTRRVIESVTKKALEAGNLRMPVLRVNDQIAATALNIQVDGKIYHWIPSFDEDFSKYSLGQILNFRMLEDAFNRGLTEIDLLRGDEDYKTRLRPELRSLVRIRIFSGSFGGRLARIWLAKVRPVIKRALHG